MIVAIITEGLKNTGFGHITRCTSIYQAFEERGITAKFFVNGNKDSEALLDGTNYEIIDWLNDQEKLLNNLKLVDVVIIDSYLADLDLYKNISAHIKYPVFIDDNIRIIYPSGTIINGTIQAEEFDYNQNENNDLLLGSKYIPLRKEFWTAPVKRINKYIETILITLGGQDIRNLTPRIIEKIKLVFPVAVKKVVIGCGFNNIDEIEKVKDEKTELVFNPDAEKMRELMVSSDAAISAAGQTLYELALTGVPTVAVGVADNQRKNIEGWEKAGFIKFAGWWNDEQLLENVSKEFDLLKDPGLRSELSEIGRKHVDGLGAGRIADYLANLICRKEGFYLRKASADDSENVLKLSNDYVVRQNSISQREITQEEHDRWFANKINNENYDFFAAYNNDKFAGQCRFEINSPNATISVSLTENFRGKGLASKLIRKSCEIVFFKRDSINQIIAYIRKQNISSVKGFEKAGFEYTSNEVINGEEYLLYILDKKKIS